MSGDLTRNLAMNVHARQLRRLDWTLGNAVNFHNARHRGWCLAVQARACDYTRSTIRQPYAGRSTLHMPMPIISALTLAFRIKLDQRIDPHDGYAGLDRTLQLLHLAHARLQHARLHAVLNPAFAQIEAVVAVALRFRKRFGVRVDGALRLRALGGLRRLAVGLLLMVAG